jgi:general stress protein YciG
MAAVTTTESKEHKEEEEQEENNNNNKKTERKYKINKATNKKITGLASPMMDPTKLREIALAGGLSAHKTRGLQSANAETLKRVALAGGKARARDVEGLRRAGLKGGNALKELKESVDVQYYQQIGQRGGCATLERYSIEFYSTIGKKGSKKKNGNNKKKNSNKNKKKTNNDSDGTFSIST